MNGIIAGALGGLGQGMQQVGQNLHQSAMQDDAASNQRNLLQLQNDLALQKEQAIEQFRTQLGVDTSNQVRQAQVDRIANAKQGIIGQALASKYGDYDAALAGNPNSGTPLTPEQQAVIDGAQGMVGGEKSADAARLMNDPDIATKAAISTGDIDPKAAAMLASQKDIAQLRQENFRDRTDAMVQMRQIAGQAQVEAANIRAQAAEERAKNGQVSASMKTMLINSENANIKASTSEMNMLSRQLDSLGPKDPARAQINARIDELRGDIKESQANKNSYMQDLGILKPGGTNSNPNGAGGAKPSAADPLGLFPGKH